MRDNIKFYFYFSYVYVYGCGYTVQVSIKGRGIKASYELPDVGGGN